MSEHTDLLIEDLQLQAENRRLNEQLEQMKNLTTEMFTEFKDHRPNGTLAEQSRESIRLNAGGTIYFVQYVDRTGKSYISTEGFTPEGDIAPKLFYFGFAVFFLVEELTRQGFSCLPERFSNLFDRNPKFMSYIIKEFEGVISI
jgi:hypothetical protein